MSKVILLSRISTGLQDIEQQTKVLINYAHNLGYKDSDLISIEDTESAVKLSEEERNGLNKLKSYILSTQISDVIVYELSRIARTPKVLYSIRDFLIEHHVQLHVINPQFKLLKSDGTIDESANVIFSLFCSMAENEGYLRKQRFARGKTKLRNENKYTGGSVPFGYTVNSDKDFIIKEDEAQLIRDIYKMYQTMTIRDIANELILTGRYDGNINSVQTLIRNILHREYYTGKRSSYNGFKNNVHTYEYPAIISCETFDEAKKKIHERKKYSKTKSKHEYLCRGLVVNINREGLKPYYCHNTYTFVKVNKYNWESLSIKMDFLDNIAWYYTKQSLMTTPKNLSSLIYDTKKELTGINYKVKKNLELLDKENKKILVIERRLLDEKISEDAANKLQEEIQSNIDKLNRDNQSLEARRKELNSYLRNLSSSGNNPFGRNLDTLPITDKIKLVHQEIGKIVVIKGVTRNSFTLGIQYVNGDYVIVDCNSRSKKVWDENGVEVNIKNLQ